MNGGMNGGMTVHGSAVRIAGRGVLVRGASGAGKSSLVLSVLYARRDEACLVADDQVELSVVDARLMAAPPAALAGLLEVRGQGLLRQPFVESAALDLLVDLLPLAACERAPEPAQRQDMLLGVALPRIFIAQGAVDGPARIAIALAAGEAVTAD